MRPSVEANGTLGPLAGELKGVLGTSIAITRNADGEIVRVGLVTTREGKATGTVNSGQKDLGGNASSSGSDGTLTVTTASLDVTTRPTSGTSSKDGSRPRSPVVRSRRPRSTPTGWSTVTPSRTSCTPTPP